MCVKEEPMKEKKQNTRKLPGKVIAAITFNNLASNCMWMLTTITCFSFTQMSF